jgi:hypothetical protein
LKRKKSFEVSTGGGDVGFDSWMIGGYHHYHAL